MAKALGVADGTGDTNLEGLYKSLTNGSEDGEGGGSGSGSSSSSAHEAGHDAFMTGVIFASLLRTAAAAAAEAGGAAAGSGGPPSLTHAEAWLSKVFLRLSDIDSFDLRNFKQVRKEGRKYNIFLFRKSSSLLNPIDRSTHRSIAFNPSNKPSTPSPPRPSETNPKK